jgi:hypothetical protein
VRALERRREDEKALRAWARRARRRAQLRVAPITAPGEIHELTPPPARAEPGQSIGRATLQLLGLEEQVNRPLPEGEPDRPGCEEERAR